jgi:hypothetical protein
LQDLGAKPTSAALTVKRFENQAGRSFDIALFGTQARLPMELLGMG